MPVKTYMGRETMAAKRPQGTVINARKSYTGSGYRVEVATAQEVVHAFCKKELEVGQLCVVTGMMSDGETYFVDPVDFDPGSVHERVLQSEVGIAVLELDVEKLKSWIPVIEGLVHDMELMKDRYPS